MTGTWTRPNAAVTVLTVLASLAMIIPGVWARVEPHSFAHAAKWPQHEHFLHDAGVFQIALGAMLLASLRLRDGVALALGGFLLANTLHAWNHLMDLHLGGGTYDAVGLAAFTVLAAIALGLRLRQLRHRSRPGAEAAR